MQGPEEHYALCEEVAREIYKPVMRSHRCTVEQIAILEPALSETVGATLALALREATDEAVRRGVPRAGRARLHPRPPQHRARHRLRHLPRGQVLRRRAARHRPGKAADLPRRTGSSASSRPRRCSSPSRTSATPKKPPEPRQRPRTGRRRMTRLQTLAAGTHPRRRRPRRRQRLGRHHLLRLPGPRDRVLGRRPRRHHQDAAPTPATPSSSATPTRTPTASSSRCATASPRASTASS